MPDAPVSVGLCRNDYHEYFVDGQGPILSITTALKALVQPWMGPWTKKLTAEAAVKNLDLLHRQVELAGEVAAIEFLKRITEHKREKAMDMGTRAHALAEAIARKQPVEITEAERPFVTGYQDWEREWRPKYIAVEYMVCNLTHGYAGTGDGVVLVSGDIARRTFACFHDKCRVRYDTKTTQVDPTGKINGPYAETALQLAAAHFAEFSGRPNDPKRYRVPPAEHHAVLHLRSDGSHAFVPYAIGEPEFKAFLAAKQVWEWLQGPGKSVVGQAALRQEAAA